MRLQRLPRVLLFIWGPLAALAMLAGPAWADGRVDHPLQLQLDAGGLTAGYHLGRRLYVGFTGQPSYSYSRSYGRHMDDVEVYDQEGVDHVSTTYAQRNSVEVRFSPWDFGLYFALGGLGTGNAEQKIEYDNRARVIGRGAYVTGLNVKVKKQPQTTAAAGIGYLHVFRSGLSVGAGALLGTSQPSAPTVTVTDTTGTAAQSDLDRFRHRIERDNRGLRGMLHLAVGWNF
jgi:hypothetical protein